MEEIVVGCKTPFQVTASRDVPHLLQVTSPAAPDEVEGLFDVLPLTWSCWKRLFELRENLYEPVKEGTDRG